MLPLVDSLRVLEAEIPLKIPDSESGIPAALLNVAASSRKVNHRERCPYRHKQFLLDVVMPEILAE